MTGSNLRAVALFRTLTACAAAVVVDRGCRLWRGAATMPRRSGPTIDRPRVAMLDTSMTLGLPVKPRRQAVALLVGRGCGKESDGAGIRTRDPAGWPPYRVRCSAAFDHSAHAAAHPQNLAESREVCPCAP